MSEKQPTPGILPPAALHIDIKVFEPIDFDAEREKRREKMISDFINSFKDVDPVKKMVVDYKR